MSRRILGLDIKDDAVSAVLLTSSIKGIVVEAHDYFEIKEPADFQSGLSVALESLVQKMDIGAAACVASFPAERISYRNIQVPFKEPKKIRQILPYELEPMLPFAADEQVIDFVALKATSHDDHTDLISAAVEKTVLKSFLDTLATHNIEPETVTIGGYATALSLIRPAQAPKNMLLIDIDKRNGSVFIVFSGEIYMIRPFTIQPETGTSTVESIGTSVQRTWSAFEEIMGLDFQPEKVYITGVGLEGPSLEQHLSQILELPVQQTDIAEAFEITKHHHPTHPWNSLQMDNALALALMQTEGINGFNFRKGPFAIRKFWIEHKKSLIKTGIIAALVLVIAFSNVILDVYILQKKVTRLNQQISDVFSATFPDVKKIVDPYQQMRAKIEAAKKTVVSPTKNGHNLRAIDILNDLSRLIPAETDVNLARLVIGPESIVISGDTDTFNAVDDIKSRLEQADAFKKITISSANIDRSDNRIQFKLKVDL